MSAVSSNFEAYLTAHSEKSAISLRGTPDRQTLVQFVHHEFRIVGIVLDEKRT